MAQKNPRTSTKNQNTPNKPEQTSGITTAIEKQLRAIHNNFISQRSNQSDPSMEKFMEFVRTQRGGVNILSQINTKEMQVFFDAVKETGTTLSTLASHAGRAYFAQPGESESDTMDRAYGKIQNALYGMSGKWDDFCRLHRLSFSTTSGGIHLDNSAKNRTRLRTTHELHTAWIAFLAQEQIADDVLSHLLDADIPRTNTEHIMMQAIATKTRAKMDPSLRAAWDNHIGAIDAYGPLQTMADLMDHIDRRKQSHPETADTLDTVVIRNRDLYQAYQARGGQGRLDGDFSTWDRSLQNLIGRNTTLAHASTYHDSVDHLESTLQTNAQQMHLLHPKLGSLFARWPSTDSVLRQSNPNYRSQIESLHTQLNDSLLLQKSDDPTERLQATEQTKTLHGQREELRWLAWVDTVRADDTRLADILTKGPSLHFDFSKLSHEDQCYLGYACARPSLEPRDEGANVYGIDRQRYTDFVTNIFDPDTNEIRLPTDAGQELVLPLRHKGFLPGGVHPDKLNISRIEEMDHLGFSLDVDITDENEAGLRKLYPKVFFDVNSGTQTCAPSYKVRLPHPETGQPIDGYLMHSLVVDGQTSDNQTNTNTEWYLFSTPPTDPTNTYPGDEPDRLGVSLGNNIDRYDVEILDRSLPLNGDALNTLTLGWALGDRIQHPRNPSDQQMSASRDDMVESNQIGEDAQPYIDSYQREESQTPDDHESVEDLQDDFLREFVDRIKGPAHIMDDIKQANDVSQLKGKHLRMHNGASKIPPRDGSAPFYAKCEITDVDPSANEIELTIHGTDNTMAGEGQRLRFPMTTKTLQTRSGATDDGNVYMIPPFSGQGDDLVGYKNMLIETGLADKEDMAVFGGLTLDKKSRKRNSDDEAIAYFSGQGTFTPEKGDEVTAPFTYEVTRRGPDSFQIRSPHGYYDRVVDLPTFLLFMSNRGLKGMTKDEKDAHEQRVLDPKGHKLAQGEGSITDRNKVKGGRYSLASVIAFFKEGQQKFKDNLENHTKKQTEDMTDIFVRQYGIYDKLGGLTKRMGPAVSDAFGDIHGDYIQEIDKKIFDIINSTKEYLSQNPDGAAVVQGNVVGLLDDAANGKRPSKRRDLLSAAGKYLYMLEDHGDAYGNALRKYRGSGLWVRILGGEWHYQNYLKRAADLQAKIDADPGNAHLLEEFADMENRYIHQHIADNPGFKGFYSKKFSDAVIGAKWKGNSSERINKTVDIFAGQKDFPLNETLFGLKLKDGDIGKAVGHLKAMALTATTSGEVNKVRMYLLELMLSGIVLYQTNDATKGVLESIASKMGFIPGTWVKDPHQKHKIKTLLDYITGGNFSKSTGYQNNMFNRINYGKAREDEKFHNKYKDWMKNDMNRVCDFLTLNNINKDGQSNILSIVHKIEQGEEAHSPTGSQTTSEVYDMLSTIKTAMMSNAITGADRDLQNKYLFKSPLSIPNSVLSGQLAPDRNGQLTGSSAKEIAMKEVFRSSLNGKMPTHHVPGGEMFFIEKFRSLFGNIAGHSAFQQTLITAQDYLQKGKTAIAKRLLKGIFGAMQVQARMNNTHPLVKDILKKYETFFANNIQHMSHGELKRAFNMTGDVEGFSNKVKEYIPGRDRRKNKSKCPPHTLNYTLYQLKRAVENEGGTFDDYFGGSSRGGAKGKVVNMYPNRVPVQNPDQVYGTPVMGAGAETPVISMNDLTSRYTPDQIQEAIERQIEEDDVDNGVARRA